MATSLSKILLPRRPGTIRRFHVTPVRNLESISKEGLLPSDPFRGANKGTGVYTSVDPVYWHNVPGEAAIAIDIPKAEYKTLAKLPHNPETPVYRRGMGTTERLKDDIDYCERFIIDTIKDKGRVDIFSDRLKPEWFTDIIYSGPDDNIYRFKSKLPDMPNDITDTWYDLNKNELDAIIDRFNKSNPGKPIGDIKF